MPNLRVQKRENTPDSLNEFLAQLLTDIPDLPTSSITFAPAPISTSTTAPYYAPNAHPTCQWVSSNNPPFVCGAVLSQDPKLACDHFRQAHDVRGNEKVHVNCHWRDCNVPPMLRGSLIRHVLTVHLGLLRWQCELCGKVFSRRGTGHACVEDH